MATADDIRIGLEEIEADQDVTMSYLGTDYPVCTTTIRRGEEIEFGGRATTIDRTAYLRVEEFSGLTISTLAGKQVTIGSAAFRVVSVALDPHEVFATLELASIVSGR